MGRSVYRSIRLDANEDAVLQSLAERSTHGNVSLLVRQLIEIEARQNGMWPSASATMLKAPSERSALDIFLSRDIHQDESEIQAEIERLQGLLSQRTSPTGGL
jgi:hypothetical protein